jgi:hypothetical protein
VIQESKEEAMMSFDLVLELTYHQTCHMLLVTQINLVTMWEGPRV